MIGATQHPVAIVGGGLAGLTAAAYLRRHGVPVRLYEAGPRLAGLAQSFQDEDGFTYDFGAHFITNRLAAALGIGALCRDVRQYGESVLLKGRASSYPLGLLRNFRFTGSAVASRLRWSRRPVQSAADWFSTKYGPALADKVANPLTEAWSGLPASELSPAVADSIPGSIAETLLLKAMGRLTRRAVAIGYSREVPASSHVWHVYPEGGLGLLCNHLARELNDIIELQSPVEAIEVENNRAVAVRVNGRRHEAAAVVSTAPCHILAKLVQGTNALKYLERFRYRPMVFVNLRLQGRGLLPDVVLWTPEKQFPFFRLTETPMCMPWLAPEGKTLVTVDIGCEVGDAFWAMPDEQLGEYCVKYLEAVIPDVRQRYLGCRVLRTPVAYPVFARQYESDRRRFAVSTEVEGLYCVGRNAQFAHIFMEDVYWRTLNEMRRLRHHLAAQTSSDCSIGRSRDLALLQ
jgi:protoporphyrinogen/coproporphyrinogen III oxidase